MAYQIINPRTFDGLLDLQTIKTHLRIYDGYDDEYLTTLTSVAVELAEKELNRLLTVEEVIMQTEKYLEQLPLGKASSITLVTYEDRYGVRKTLSNDEYSLNTITNKLDYTKSGLSIIDNDAATKFQITFTTGYETIPTPITHALLLIMSTLYEQRENAVIGSGVTVNEVSMSSRRLLSAYKIRTIGDL